MKRGTMGCEDTRQGCSLTQFRADNQKVSLRAQSLQLSWPVRGWLQQVEVRGGGWFLQETSLVELDQEEAVRDID